MYRSTIAFLTCVLALNSCHKTPLQTATLRYAHSWQSRPDDLAKINRLSETFLQQTGIRIVHIPTPESTHDYLELSRKLLRAGVYGTDLMTTDLIWPPLLEPDLLDLRTAMQDELSQIEPELLRNYTVRGRVVAIPFNVPIGGLEYRADLLRKYGYKHPPKTWDELESMAQRIQAGERAGGKKDFWGYVWQGTAAETLTCNALEWQASEGGGKILEDDGTISVNNPVAIRAWLRAKRWIGGISPPSVLAYRERDTMNVFDSGGAAFNRLWLITPISKTGQARHIHWRSLTPKVETGFASMPAGGVGSRATLGGNGLAISRHTTHPSEAIALERFLIQAQLKEGGLDDGGLPRQPVLYDPPAIGSSGQAVIIARPSMVAGTAYERVTSAYFNAVHSVLTGEKDAYRAAAELEQLLVAITGYHTGPSR